MILWHITVLVSAGVLLALTRGEQPAAGSSSSILAELSERFFKWRIRESPEYGTNFGLNDLDNMIEQYTEQQFLWQIRNATSFLKETESVKRDELMRQEQITLDILKYNLRTFIDGYPYRRFGMYNFITPMERPTDEWEGLVNSMKLQTAGDYQKLLERLKLLPSRVDEMITLMRAAILAGTTVHNVSLTGAVVNLEKEIVSNATLSPLYALFITIPESINSTTRIRLENEGQKVILNDVVPAWQRMLKFINEEYAPRTRRNIAVTSLPGGAEFYQACLKWHTSTNMTPREIFDLGMKEVERISEKMQLILRQEGFNGTVRQFIAYLNSQPSNFYTTEEDLLNGYERIIEEVHKKLHLVLLKIPKYSVVVKKSANPEGPGGSYSDPPLDNSRPGEFIVNVFHPETEGKYDMYALTLHEAEPGHHTQATYSMEAELPYFRRAIEFRKYNAVPFNWPFYTAYVEGWALYAESLGEEMDIYPDRLAMFGRYASEIFRACRLVIDTGIHAFGWSKDDAFEFFMNHTTGSQTALENELNRYISWPGQACAYKVGELKIKELRRRAEAKLGSKFDRRHFHDQVLELGAAPLSILETRIDEWIADTLAGNTVTPSAAATIRCRPHVRSISLSTLLLVLLRLHFDRIV